MLRSGLICFVGITNYPPLHSRNNIYFKYKHKNPDQLFTVNRDCNFYTDIIFNS